MAAFAKFTIPTAQGDKLVYVNPALFMPDSHPRPAEGKDRVTTIDLKLSPTKHLLVAPFGKLEVSGRPEDIQKEIEIPSFTVPEDITLEIFGGSVKTHASDIDFVTKGAQSTTLAIYMTDGKTYEAEKIHDTAKRKLNIEKTLAAAAKNQHPGLQPVGPLIE